MIARKTPGVSLSVFGKKALIHLVLLLGTVFTLLPFLIMVFSSFKVNAEIMKLPITIFPKKFVLSNYEAVFAEDLLLLYKNTVIVSASIVFLQLATSSMAAYAFARLQFPLKNVLFVFVLALCMIPTYMMLIPRYRMLSSWGVSNTLLGIVLPNSVSITVVFFLRQSFLSFPKDLEEAAKIDGAGYWRTFLTIVLPLHKSAFSAMGVMVLLFAWNDFLWPNIIISSDSKRVLSIFVVSSQGMYKTEIGYLMAAGCVAIFPMIAVYALGQKAFIASITMNGIKG
ncbi:MAG: carbohydrate ABC transporter permease [Eubacteriales bacterium]|nr:carbohydrate ABC transporter permease [Eubacteriales bacterium]